MSDEADATRGKVILKRGHVKAVAMGHPWVFATAVQKVVGDVEPGTLVEVFDGRGHFLGKGFHSPQSRIPVKLFSRRQGEAIDAGFWRKRLVDANALRDELSGLNDSQGACRLVNAEGDGLPGLIVDRYADHLVVEFLTFGMAARAEMLVDLLRELVKPAGVFERCESGIARSEGFHRAAGVLWGEEPPELVEIVEGPARFLVNLRGGHKTGFYLDQRETRMEVGRLAKDRRVLDAFCYTGGFAVHAALGGAAEVLAVDSSETSLDLARKNAERNGVEVAFTRGNAFERLRMLCLEGERFDMVILDPPKLAQSRAGLNKALRAYKDANLSALRLLNPGGVLVTCCCSGLVDETPFLRTLNDAAIDADRRLKVFRKRRASPDHPFLPACPETDYLQVFFVRVDA